MRWARFDRNGTPTYGVVEGDTIIPVRGSPFEAWERTSDRLKLADVTLLVPVVPSTFYAAGLNYAEHVKEAAETFSVILTDPLGQTQLLDASGNAASSLSRGFVIGNDDPRAFSVGADLSLVSFAVAAGAWDDIALSCKTFQDSVMSIRRAPFPVVVAPAGMALGGGSEFTLHADAVQAHAETYMGLVEAGVGLLPGGGGTKELLMRFTAELQNYEEVDLFAAVKRAFKLIAFATTTTSAYEAKALGFLRDSDRISMNRDHQLADAKARVLDLARGYLPPLERTVRALGRDGLGNLEYALWAAKEAGQASAHDVRVGRAIAYVLCGGDGTPRDVTEQDLLDLEREQFLSLLGTKETQERIAYTLKTGKPLRN